MRSAATSAAVLAIDGYRRFVSPFKGFTCAHNRLYGAGSCSDFGRDAILQHGVGQGLAMIRARMQACKVAAAKLQATNCHAASAAPGLDNVHPATSQQEDEAEAQRRQQQAKAPPSNFERVSNVCDASNLCDCGLSGLDCSAPASAVDLCSVGDACACSW